MLTRCFANRKTRTGGLALSSERGCGTVGSINGRNPRPLSQDSSTAGVRSRDTRAAATSVAITVAGVFAISKALDHFGQSGPGAGVLVITAIPNIILPFFIVALTLLMHLHGRASWRTPTFAFVVGAVATWMWIGPFDAVFAPAVLGTGILAWGISCLMLRRKRLRVNC